ncbi:MAG: Diacylglycerol O-acyltransferase [Blastococcus sp.]|nr:Diacylglycerol O-acyltransferase [Blastococcus sp.]
MGERLSTLDASFLYLEEPDTPMHVSGVLILEKPPGGVEALAALVEARLSLVPRYRQRVAEVPGHLANPVWVDDPDFDIAYHVRRSGLPRPGTESQLLDVVSRLTSRRLNRSRPLWEAYLIEGLSGNRVAVVTKTHPALVDGLSAIDIGQVLLDVAPDAPAPEPIEWRPRRVPTGRQLLVEALDEYARRPSAIVETARGAVTDVRATAARLTGVAGGLLRTARSTILAAPQSPLNSSIGRQRRVAVARAELADVKKIRQVHPGTVNDVLLTVVTGALREWLLSRGEPVVAGTSVRALVPVSLQDDESSRGDRVSSYLVDLPVGEPNPRVRLTRLSYAMRGVAAHGQSVSADNLIALTGFAPPTLHALGARAARGLSRRLFNLVVTNVPGPQVPLYAAGSQMLEVFPFVPLARGQGLSIGMTSYHGRVFFGLNADRDSVSDVDVLADLIEQEVGELVDTSS